jgi:hypothetical protein
MSRLDDLRKMREAEYQRSRRGGRVAIHNQTNSRDVAARTVERRHGASLDWAMLLPRP